MPSRNALKEDVADSFYHVYARGVGKQGIFLDDLDYAFFKSLFVRYLTRNDLLSTSRLAYPYHGDGVQLLCFCLMTNHFHLLVFQREEGAMSKLMRSIMTSYSKYFNKKYKRTGPLFESRYKASRISDQSYLEHISRYIHLNPRYWKRYPHSSLRYYVSGEGPEWLDPSEVLALFNSARDYLNFVEDYEEQKLMLEKIKHELADG